MPDFSFRGEDVYYWTRDHLFFAAYQYTQGQCRWETVDNWATHVVIQIRRLHESGSDIVDKMPQA